MKCKLLLLPSLAEDIKTMKNSFASVEDHIKSLSTRVDGMEKRITVLENLPDASQLEGRVSKLETDFIAKEQWLRQNNVEIKGIPFKKSENLQDLLCAVGRAVQVEVKSSDLCFVSRVMARTKDKPIIACFINRYLKENLVAAARRNKTLSTTDLGISGEPFRIYVNDHLTRENKALLTNTKTRANELDYRFVWVKSCKIFVRKSEVDPIICIRNTDDLIKLK